MPFHGNRVTVAPAMAELAETRGRLRQRLHRQPTLHAGPGLADDGSPAVAHPRLRQRRRLRLRAADVRPPPPRSWLPHGAVGEDALLRPRPAPRLRGTAHHRHLPRRPTTGRPTGSPSTDRTGTTTCPRSWTPARASAPTSWTSTTRSPTPLSAAFSSTSGRATSGRSASWSPSPIRTTPTPFLRSTGTGTATRTSRMPAYDFDPSLDPSARASDCARSAPWTSVEITRRPGARGPPRLLRRDRRSSTTSSAGCWRPCA